MMSIFSTINPTIKLGTKGFAKVRAESNIGKISFHFLRSPFESTLYWDGMSQIGGTTSSTTDEFRGQREGIEGTVPANGYNPFGIPFLNNPGFPFAGNP